MARLVAFGCSLTFGLALPDKWPYREHHASSDYAWPSILAKRLNLQVVNNGIPSAGQTEILSNVLNFNFQQDDICVIMWSYFVRLDFYKFTEPTIGTKIHECNKLHRTYLFLTDKYQTDVGRRNWLAIQHASLYLRYKNIKSIGIMCLEDKERHPNTLYNIQIPDIIQDISWNYLDKAMDNAHPGIESHKDMAEQIYNKGFNVVY
jgi:hypothetical protein